MSIEAMKQALEAFEIAAEGGGVNFHAYAEELRQAIREHALREVQRLGQEIEQEPVAWRAPNWGHSADEYVYRDFDDPVIGVDGKPSPNNEPLFTHPPQRTWQKLTDDEVYEMYSEPTSDSEMIAFAREVEAKLKQKNGFAEENT